MALPNKILLSTSVVNIEASANSASRTLHNKDINLADWINDQITKDLINVGSADGPVEEVQIQNASETAGLMAIKSKKGTHTLNLSASSSMIEVIIPNNAIILGVSCTVDTAVTTDGGNNTFSLKVTPNDAPASGSTVSGTLNTKSNRALSETSFAVRYLMATAGNSESFTAGVLTYVVYYTQITSLDDA